jgi:hypothetical protein
MGAGGGQPHAALGGEREQPHARLALPGERVVDVGPAAGANLDLGRDQLPGDRLREHLVLERGSGQLLVALGQPERAGVEDRELLLDAHREVLGGVEDLTGAVRVEHERAR